MFKINLTHYKEQLRAACKRFWVASLFTLLSFLYNSYTALNGVRHHIAAQNQDKAIYTALIIGIISGISFQYYCENRGKLWNLPWHVLGPLSQVVICFFLFTHAPSSHHLTVLLIALPLAQICWCLSSMMTEENKDTLFPYIFSNFVSSIFAAVLMAIGGLICIHAFDALLFTLNDTWLKILLIFSLFIVGGNAFILGLPANKEEVPPPLYCRSIIGKILLAIYAFLLIILYAYIAKIFLAAKMPIGTMNWIASFAVLLFLFLRLSLATSAHKYMQLFVRKGALLLLPVVAVQLWGVWIRHAAYGLTLARYTSLLCTLFGLLALFTCLTNKSFKKLWLVGAMLAALSALGPLNAVDVAIHNQGNRLQKLLTDNQLYVAGVFVRKNDLNKDAALKMLSSANYLVKYREVPAAAIYRPLFSEQALNIYRGEGLGEVPILYTMRFVFAPKTTIAVTGYNTMYTFQKYSSRKKAEQNTRLTLAGDRKITYDLKDIIAEIAKKYEATLAPEKLKQYKTGKLSNELLYTDTIYKNKKEEKFSVKELRYLLPDGSLIGFETLSIEQNADGSQNWYGKGYVLRK